MRLIAGWDVAVARQGVRLFATVLLLALSGSCLALTPPGGVPIPSYADYGDPDDQFGSELDVDGNWMATTGVNGEAYYVYEKAGSTWLRRQRIVPPTLGQTGVVNPDLRGNRLLISRAFGVAGDGSGRVYVYERPNAASPFAYVSTVQPQDPQAGDRFGYGIAQTDDRMFVAASGRTEGSNASQGVVYVFALQAGAWVQIQRIAQTDPTVADRFGFALDFDGQDLLVGARGHRSNVGGNAATRGAVYVYRYMAGPAAWVQTQKLVHAGSTQGTQMGYNLAAKNGVMVVTAPSTGQRALLFANRDGGGNWAISQTFNNNFLGGTGFTGLPFYVDLGGSTAAASLGSFDTVTGDTGPNFTVIYQFAAGAWSRVQQIQRVDGAGVFSSAAVGVEANHVLVGQPFDDAYRNFDQGSIQAFANVNGSLTPTQRIWHGSGNSPDRLGSNVGIDGDWAITTAPGADTPAGTDVGEAYFLRRQLNGQWQFVQATGLLLNNGQPGMVDIVGNLAFVGLPNHANFGRIQVLQRQPDDRWTPLCTLQTGAAGSQLGQFLQADSSGAVASYRSAAAAPLQMMFFPLPAGSTCPAGEVFPPLQGINPAYTGAISISANRVAIGWIAEFSEGTPPASVFRAGVDVLQINNPGFTLIQAFRGDQSAPAPDRYEHASLDGNRLSLVYAVPVSTINHRRDIRLYELIGPSYVLRTTITSPYPTSGYEASHYGGAQLLALDPNVGLYGSVAVFQASTGALVQNILPTGLGVEDGGLYSLAVSGNRALLGFAEQDRGGVNNSGLVYVAENAAPSPDQVNGPPAPWQVTPVESLPRPDRVFEHDFEENF